MIGDPLVLRESDYQKAKNIQKENKYNIILVGGTSGSSKSELSYCIQKELWDKKLSSLVISLDDWYFVAPSIRSINRKKMGIDSVGLSELDWEGLKRIYEDFKNGKEIHFKRTHRFLDTIEHNIIDSDEIDTIIFEGLFANYLKKFYSDNFSVYLEGSPSQTLEFRKMRGKEDEQDSYRFKVVDKEYNIVCQLRKYADLILPFGE